MPASEPLPARLIGALFVERGLVSESQIRVALEIQRETGQQLGQVLVERFGVSRRELASVVAEQWAKLGGSSGPEDSASWRRLGEIFVERGFVSEDELQQALTRQRQTGERLGEALVAQGVISKFELAGALAEQMATLGDPSAEDDAVEQQPEATVHHLPARSPDPAEVPFGALVEPDAADAGPQDAPIADEHVAGDVGEPAGEPEDVAAEVEEVTVMAEEPGEGRVEAVVDAPEEIGRARVEAVADVPDEGPDLTLDIGAPSEPVEAIAIDDVGHISLVGPATEVAEPGPSELFEDLRGTIAADASSAEERRPEPLPSVACLAFAPTTDGYRLVALESLPQAGETIAVPDVGERLVLRVGRSPLPGDRRPCAYVEEPVTPAPVAALAH